MKITYDKVDELHAEFYDQPITDIDLDGWTFYYLRCRTTISPSPGVEWTDSWPLAYLALELIHTKKVILDGDKWFVPFTESQLKINFDPRREEGFVIVGYQVIDTEEVKIPLQEFCGAIDLFVATLAADLSSRFPGIEENEVLRPLFTKAA